ncbi:MAG: hypothetical protein AB3N06_01535 [Erythrobacter sp.]
MNRITTSRAFQNGLLLTILILLAASFIMLNQLKYERELGSDFELVEAEITGFGTNNSDSSLPPGITVSAISKDGLIGQRRVSPDRVRGCKIGDSIKAERSGVHLKLTPSPCTPAVK